MKHYSAEQEEFKRILISCIENSGLIPIIGAGFTKGMDAFKGKVPDGRELEKMMVRSMRSEHLAEQDKIDKISSRDLKEISRYYMKNDYVSKERRNEDLINNFTRVKLDPLRTAFIKNNWSYVYTLNIDDAIERTNTNLRKILPYKKIEKNVRNINLVYKIHGCATEETTYEQSDSLIFTEAQYIRSLIKNEHILNDLKNDLCTSNLIYIGCSLDRELDLMYAVSGSEKEISQNSSRIFFHSGEIDELEEDRLEEYGINILVKIDDYDEIYRVVNSAFAESQKSKGISIVKFNANQVHDIGDNKNDNIRYILQGCGDEVKDLFSTPNYTGERNITRQILKSVEQQKTICILKGKRFTGKSLLLKQIATNVKNKNTYYIPSAYSLNEDDIGNLVTAQNSLFLIDSNVISFIEATEIRKKINEIKRNKTCIIIACNPTEIDIANTFSSFDIDANYIEVDNALKYPELQSINVKLSSLGIANWEKRSFLDNVYTAARHYPTVKQSIVKRCSISAKELKLLILVAVLDKVYISISRYIDIGPLEAKSICSKISPVLEVVRTDESEKHYKSDYKITSNSKPWLFKIIKDQHSKLGSQRMANILSSLIKTFSRNSKLEHIPKKLIMFDTMNQIISQHGGASLHKYLYDELQPILSSDPDYWLQRAKAISKTSNNQDELKNAVDYAIKAYQDSARNKTVVNAEFTLAVLYGKICKLEDYSNGLHITQAIRWYYSSIKNHQYNREYISSMLDYAKDGKGLLHELTRNILAGKTLLKGDEKLHFNEIREFINHK